MNSQYCVSCAMKYFTVFSILILLVSTTFSITSFAESNLINKQNKDNFHEGIIEWVSRCTMVGSNQIVRVSDHDMNQDTEKIEYFDIEIWSDSENKTVRYTVYETGNNTGVFDSTVFLTDGESPGKSRVQVFEGDTVFAKYNDYTIPNTSEKDVIATFTPSELPVLERENDGRIGKLIYDPCTVEFLDKNKNSSVQFNVVYPAPLKQIKSGLFFHEIICKEGLALILKYDSYPACVKPETKEKLLERGWAVMTPKERHNNIENILKEEDCVEFGRWLDKFAFGNFNENQLTFEFPVSEETSDRIYEFLPHCVFDDSGGFFRLNTKHIVDFEKLENPDALLLPKPNPIEEQYRERYDIEIVGLKDKYALGEKYSFYFVISGHGHECTRINMSYPDEDGKLVGWGQEPLCDANIAMRDFEVSYDNRQELFGNVAVKNPGTYTVTVIFDQPSKYFPTTATKEFHVIGN